MNVFMKTHNKLDKNQFKFKSIIHKSNCRISLSCLLIIICFSKSTKKLGVLGRKYDKTYLSCSLEWLRELLRASLAVGDLERDLLRWRPF